MRQTHATLKFRGLSIEDPRPSDVCTRNSVTQKRGRILRNHSTDAERHLWQRLRARQLNGHRFRRQVPIGRYIVDFACLEAKLLIELDGSQHQENRMYDERRESEMEARGFR